MPFSFIEIEEKKTRLIGSVFFFIIAFYFVTSYLVLFVLKFSYAVSAYTERARYSEFYDYSRPVRESVSPLPTGKETLLTFGVALLIGLIHWSTSTSHLISRMSLAIGAIDADLKDTYHQTLKNVIEEVSVAIGGRPIDALVIPTVACNAFALEDFGGRAVIGVTEGLLTRLSRAQLEAVVGHEAGHIVNGDCLSTTVTSSLAELYEEVFQKLSQGSRETRGRGWLVILLLYLVLGGMKVLSALLRYFISRQKEYRADATSVRLTRDPLSLAEALYLISRNWRGSGAQGENLESIFILNPNESSFDERTDVISNWMSTHPPIGERIRILADMGHLDPQTLEENLKKFHWVSPVAKAVVSADAPTPAGEKKWMVFNREQKWEGPFGLEELGQLTFLTPETWICPHGGQDVRHAYENEELMPLFGGKAEAAEGDFPCPHCHTALSEITYEGAPAMRCPYCEGIFVENEAISRILIRRDMTFSEDVVRLAEAATSQKDLFQKGRTRYKTENPFVLTCPKCANKMRRQFFVYSYPIEIDRCLTCSGLWFDKLELEVLQYIYENKDKFFDGKGF